MPRRDYIGWLKFADIILVPYEPSAYADRTSGVFADAIASGSIPVTIDGTWMAHELQKYGLGELILDWDNPEITRVLFSLREQPCLRTKLDRMRDDYAMFHSMPGYARTLERILAEGALQHPLVT
jgi:hypothetical protein